MVSRQLQTQGQGQLKGVGSPCIYQYIVANAQKDPKLTKEILTVIHEQGLPAPNVLQAPKRLAEAVNKSGKVNETLAKLHPDRALIINEWIKEKGLLENANACGCMGADGEQVEEPIKKENFNADDTTPNTKAENMQLILKAGIAISLISIIGLIVVSSSK